MIGKAGILPAFFCLVVVRSVGCGCRCRSAVGVWCCGCHRGACCGAVFGLSGAVCVVVRLLLFVRFCVYLGTDRQIYIYIRSKMAYIY